MKVTKIETVRLTSRPTLIWVRVHTDEGLIGLGESWFGCAAVDADIHERIAPALIGADPSRIEALTRATRPYVGFCGTGAEIRAASAIDVALWDISEFIRTRLLSITLVVGFGFLLMVSLILDAGLTWVGTYLEASFSGFTVILQILNSATAFGIAALFFAMIFKILPAVPLTWRDVGMGAAMTALLFMSGKFVIGYYIGKSGVASAYGAAASIITLLLWIYYSSLVLLFGAEFTKAYAENRGSRTEVPINPRQGLSFLRHRSGTEAEPRLRSGPLCARSCHPAGTSSFPISDIRGTGSSSANRGKAASTGFLLSST